MENSVTLDMSEYYAFRNEKPRGVGNWTFRIGGENVWYGWIPFPEAKRMAIGKARADGIGVVVLLA